MDCLRPCTRDRLGELAKLNVSAAIENEHTRAGHSRDVMGVIHRGAFILVMQTIRDQRSRENHAALWMRSHEICERLPGPATLSLSCGVGFAGIVTYKITTIANVASQAANTQAVELPADTIAPIDVILETSTDLATWIAALPGNYAPAPEKRFFRLRTVLD